MKVFAVAATLLASVASAADCDVAVLAPLLEETYVAKCSTDTGFTFVPPSIPPADVVAKVCKSDACKQTLAKLESFGLGDCLLLSTLNLETDLINPINAKCGFSASTGSGSAGSAGVGSDVAAPVESSDSSSSSEVETPAPTSGSADATEAPATSGSADTTEAPATSGSADTTEAPATSSEATPTPTPTDNGATHQTAAIAAAAIAVTVVAAL